MTLEMMTLMWDICRVIQRSVLDDEDLSDIWEQVLGGKNILLWCDGMLVKHQRKRAASTSDADSDDGIKKKTKKKKTDTAREDKVEKIVHEIKDIHGDGKYTPMQIKVWGEMVAGGIHASLNDPPSTTMFARCGSVSNTPKRKSSSDVIIQAMDKLSEVLSPKSLSPVKGHSHMHSAAKVIDNRSKCYKQLAELNNLSTSGVLTDEEYKCEKDAIMASLKLL